MKRQIQSATLLLAKVEPKHIRLALAISTLALLALVGGAPASNGCC